MSFNRYKNLNMDGKVSNMPPVKITERSTDYYVPYKRGVSRLDLISYDYYGDANYDWIILIANQDVADMEFDIPDNYLIRVPYPLETALKEYNDRIEAYRTLYGFS